VTTATETPTETVIFASPKPDFRLVRISRDVIRNEGGRRVAEVAPGSRHNERYGIEDDGSPWDVTFSKGLLETSDPIIIEWLRSHRQNGVGFFEQNAKPTEVRPTLAEQKSRTIIAAGRADVDDLQALLAEEKATHNRAPVIEDAEAALKALAEGPSQEGADAENPGNGDPSSTSPS
jgi:hypothetical protein